MKVDFFINLKWTNFSINENTFFFSFGAKDFFLPNV